MDRGALVGGIAVVGLLAVFAAVFVMVGVGTGDSGKVPESRRVVSSQPPAAQNWAKSPTRPGKPRLEGDPPESPPIVTDDGVIRRPNPDGLGAEKWAEILAAKNAGMEARSRAVVDSFVASMSEEDGAQMREIFEDLYVNSAAIRSELQSGSADRNVGREQLGELRAKTITDLTTLMGGEDFARLRVELRRADAAWF